MKKSRGICLWAFLLLGGCNGAGGPCPAVPVASVFTDGMVDADGISFHLHCAGAGSPTVIFDAGRGVTGDAWNYVTPEIHRLTRACVYDRAGLGYSDPARRPHTSADMVRELHALLTAAKVSGPYVLVGHSFAGLNVRLYASKYPQEVVGMVLVDAVTEDHAPRLWKILSAEQLRALEERLRDTPDGVTFDAYRESIAQVRDSKRTLGDMPLVVLSHGKPFPREVVAPNATEEQAAELERILRDAHAELARLSSNSALVVAEKSGNFMQVDAPNLVVAAVQEVVESARTHRQVDQARLSAFAGDFVP